MKISTLILLTFANCVFQTSFAGTEIKNVNEQTVIQVLTSNDVESVISILPDIETLWPQQPEKYFQSVRKAANMLGGATNNSSAKLALLNIFSNMIKKPFPTNVDLAVPCLEEKDNIILYYMNFEEVRNDKSKWLAIAKYVGEIRDQIIPNFVPKTIYLNPPGTMDPSPEKVRQAIQENNQNKTINNFQQSLRTANSVLTFQLLHNCTRFPSDNPTNVDFIKGITSAAHLTEEEQHQLQ